ncbi:MAG: DSD1 family PLP-dependent enzyme [Alphaproteobacteria bacterium]|nr:DSD1 family PLP-dependent enzyme [Alphaproteobacteria bacterium]
MTETPRRLADLPTPALVLDRARLSRNIQAMTDRYRALGVRLRPHLKTAKSVDVARMAVDGHFGGIAVSTLKEAEHFAANGFRDILYAVCVSPAKLDQAARLIKTGVALTLITDDLDAAKAIAARGKELSVVFDVLVEIDCGEKRSGVPVESDTLMAIARTLHAGPGSRLAGILVHAGHSYACRTLEAVAEVAEIERATGARAAERLKTAGLPCGTVSVGSTPTALHGKRYDGVTEVRCGVYMFGDLFQSEIGSCGEGDIAVSVLSSVIGQRRPENRVLIDAGALALSKDRSTANTPHDLGFGRVVDLSGTTGLGAVSVVGVHQEHGMVEGRTPLPFDRLPVGARVRVLPNHACLTSAAYDRYHVVDGSDEIVAVWPRCNGW